MGQKIPTRKDEERMNWKEKMKAFGGADVSFLSEDGEMVTFVVIGDPELIEGKFQKQDTKRIGIPCVTIEGFTLLVIGMRVGRRLSKYEDHLAAWAFELIRHGEPGDTKAKYELARTQDAELEKRLLASVSKAGYLTEIIDAVESAQEIAGG